MSLSNSVLRRYTPPTCTLQVVAYSSPVSRWVGRSVVKQVQFDLGLDDPRLPEEKRFRITGDGDRLEALHIAVTNYIQQLLSQSPESFHTTFWTEAPAEDNLASSSTTDVDTTTEESNFKAPVNAPAAPEEIVSGDRIFLKPGAGLVHQLFLGSLATTATGRVIPISTLQLFDLATALDDYAADLVALPTPSRTRTSAAPMAWANIAAVLLLGVGVSALALQIFNRSNPPQTAKNIAPRNNNSQVALAPAPFPTVTPAETLTPPPALSSISPSPSISSQAPRTIIVPSTPASPPASPGNTTPVPSNSISTQLPPQPVVVNPNPNQTTVVIPVPGQKNAPNSAPVPPSIAIVPNSTNRNANIPVANTSNSNSAARQSENVVVSDNPPPAPPQLDIPPAPTPTNTAYNDVPQVAEVREYFNRRWEPPASLKQSLQYSIVLDVDGTVQLIEPYGAASRTYLDRTGMPLIGERFVSPNASGQNPRIRVLFNPDGKVQTFLEAADGR